MIKKTELYIRVGRSIVYSFIYRERYQNGIIPGVEKLSFKDWLEEQKAEGRYDIDYIAKLGGLLINPFYEAGKATP